jgi:hypothetical protein
VRRCFYLALLFKLVQPDGLQTMLNIKAEISLFIKMTGPSCHKSPLRVLGLGRNLHYRLPQELEYAVLKRILAWIPCADRDEALDQRLKVSSLRAPDIRSLALYLVNRIICTQSSISK